jgi:glycosyltransferase involved in cell wall biosynthesis
LRILHLIGDLKLPPDPEAGAASGVVRAVLEIARAQAELGHEVSVAAVGQQAWKTEWRGVRLIQLPTAPWARIRFGRRTLDFRVHVPYMALTRQRSFDIVQGHLYSYMRFLPAKARVAHFHIDPFHRGSGERNVAWSDADFRVVSQTTNAQVAVSHFIADQLRRGLGHTGNIYQVSNGVDTEHFDSLRYQRDRSLLRQEWGAGPDDVVFLFAGAIVPEKGVLHLARAFKSLSAKYEHVHLALAGSQALWEQNLSRTGSQGDYESELQVALDSRTVTRVHALGILDSRAMPKVYAASDVAVVPSVWGEPFPLVALEALASGRPIIASDIGGLPEIVNSDCGLLFPPGDERALEAAMCTLAQDTPLRSQLGRAARERATRFTWAEAALTLDRLYSQISQQIGQI